jgi:hypothetical protein
MPLPRDAACKCCGERTREFLFMPDGKGNIWCGNCRKARMFGLPCPHQARPEEVPTSEKVRTLLKIAVWYVNYFWELTTDNRHREIAWEHMEEIRKATGIRP